MKTITVEYFAILKDHCKKSEEVCITDAYDAKGLYLELNEHYAFPVEKENLKVSVNDSFVSWDHEIQDGDKLVLMTPVSGG
jgi:molybdopterin converting factor small subunit